MPIKLNPCAKCGGEAKVSYSKYADGTRDVDVFCQKCGIGCGMKSTYGAKTAIQRHWNAANPKEGNTDE